MNLKNLKRELLDTEKLCINPNPFNQVHCPISAHHTVYVCNQVFALTHEGLTMFMVYKAYVVR